MGFFRFKALGDRLKPKDKKPPEGGYLNSYCSIFPGVNAWARESILFKRIRLTTHPQCRLQTFDILSGRDTFENKDTRAAHVHRDDSLRCKEGLREQRGLSIDCRFYRSCIRIPQFGSLYISVKEFARVAFSIPNRK